MTQFKSFVSVWVAGILILVLGADLEAVRRDIQDRYVQQYRDKAMFLKVPVRGARQVVYVRESGPLLDRSNQHLPVTFPVGEQVRITDVSFRGDHVRFRLSATDLSRDGELVFQFSARLTDDFVEEQFFRAALQDSFTEGLTLAEIESAREAFIQGQFDHLIQQFATTTGTSRDFVIRSISEQNPEYQTTRRQATELRNRLQKVESELAEATSLRRESTAELTGLRRELQELRTGTDSLRGERDRATQERDELQREINRTRSQLQQYEQQISQMTRTLDHQEASKLDLGKRLEALSGSLRDLQSDRDKLTGQVNELTEELEAVRRERTKLDQELRTTRDQRNRLDSELKELTRDKDSLQSRFLEMRRRTESLETAETLAAALRLDTRIERGEEGEVQVSEVYLLSQRIGTLEIHVPSRPGRVYPVRFTTASPETVSFTDEERRLYNALGEGLRINTAWNTRSETLQTTLLETEPLQEVGIREQAEWRWSITGGLDDSERLTLSAHLVDSDGNRVPLIIQDFEISPGGILFWARRNLSPLSLLLGVLLGGGALSLVFGLRGRSGPRSDRRPSTPRRPATPPTKGADVRPKEVHREPARESDYVTRKNL